MLYSFVALALRADAVPVLGVFEGEPGGLIDSWQQIFWVEDDRVFAHLSESRGALWMKLLSRLL